MSIKMVKAIIQDDRHLETKQAIEGVKQGQEIEIIINLKEETGGKNKTFSFSDHNFGQWRGGQIRREEIYHEDGR